MAPLRKSSRSLVGLVCAVLFLVVVLPTGLVEAAKTSNSRKLLATLTQDYTVFCAGQTYTSFVPVFQTPFDNRNYISAVDVCNLANLKVPSTGENLLNPTITGTFTEETIPGGRRLSLHIEGSGVFASAAAFFDSDFIPGVPFNPPRFVGVNAVLATRFRETVPSTLTKEDFLLITATASFTYDLVWEMTDGKGLGEPVTISYFDIFDPDLATILLEEIFLTVKGPIRPASGLSYPLGNLVIISQHQKQLYNAFIDPFSATGSPAVNEIQFNLLSPDANTARTAELISQVVSLTGTAAPVATTSAPVATGSAAPVGTTGAPTTQTGGSVGGTCDPLSALPNQCFNENGSAYVCCPAGCPSAPGATPACG